IAANRLDGKLRNHDWAGFAKGYNGASFGKNAYDIRLADAFRKWSGIKDTPWPPAATAQPPAPVPIPQAPQLNGSRLRRQSRAGLESGPDRCPDSGPRSWLRWSPQSSPCFER
ncbi:MAG: N-acetylmuramidase family protein, partial [Mesorhizobium sp.]